MVALCSVGLIWLGLVLLVVLWVIVLLDSYMNYAGVVLLVLVLLIVLGTFGSCLLVCGCVTVIVLVCSFGIVV